MKLRDTLKINALGHLEIGDADCVDLVARFGTPLYCMDEAYMRRMCRDYVRRLADVYPDAKVVYASKAFCTLAVYRIVHSEGFGADVVSGGELYTARKAGMPADEIYFHGNNKTAQETEYAVREGVHAIVVDSEYEIDRLDEIAARYGKTQQVLVRVNPGVDAHTHRFIQTARPDSKFGFPIADGIALGIVAKILQKPHLRFLGLHCHIGSQIFERKPFMLAVDKMTDFAVQICDALHADVRELNMGGGYGISYTDLDTPLAPWEYTVAVAEQLKACAAQKKLSLPKLIFEPGRSIVGEAGITLYTVGAVKEIPGIKKYIAVDGGMGDNPRYMLYGSRYDAVLADRAAEKATETVTVAGKCCESGDILIDGIALPQAKAGDILAVFATGAYNYSMASNYNRNPVPPVVLVHDGNAEYIVKPQSYEDLIARDVIPAHLGE